MGSYVAIMGVGIVVVGGLQLLCSGLSLISESDGYGATVAMASSGSENENLCCCYCRRGYTCDAIANRYLNVIRRC